MGYATSQTFWLQKCSTSHFIFGSDATCGDEIPNARLAPLGPLLSSVAIQGLPLSGKVNQAEGSRAPFRLLGSVKNNAPAPEVETQQLLPFGISFETSQVIADLEGS
jgi:hypothetical protein